MKANLRISTYSPREWSEDYALKAMNNWRGIKECCIARPDLIRFLLIIIRTKITYE